MGSITQTPKILTAETGAPPPELRHAIDPLGAIEKLAKILCRDDESRRSEKWEDYWAEAEAWLVKGLGGEGQGGRTHRAPSALGLSPEFAELALVTEPKLLPVLAKALLRPINDHEACCLGYILRTNALVWSDQKKDPPLLEEKIGELLASLSFEYLPEFYDQDGANDFTDMTASAKASYWTKRLKKIRDLDEPLGYSDQNTIMRLREQICRQPEIAALEFQDV